MGVPQQAHDDQSNERPQLSSAPPAHSAGDAALTADNGQDRPAVDSVTNDSGSKSPVAQSPSPSSPPPLPAENGHGGGSDQQLDQSGIPSEPFYPGTTGTPESEAEDNSKCLSASVASEGETLRSSVAGKSNKVIAEQENRVRLPELKSAKKTPGRQQSGGGGVVFGGGGGGGGAGGNSSGVSVTVLTLDGTGQDLTRPRSRLHQQQGTMPMTPRTSTMEPWDRDNVTDLKLVRDFQIRRKYGRRSGHVQPSPTRDKIVDLGLSGTRYFNNAGNTNDISAGALDSPRSRKSALEEKFGRLQHQNSVGGGSSSIPPTPLVGKGDEEDGALKDLASPASGSFPPLSSGTVRAGIRSENSFYVTGRRTTGQSPSLLVNHFGFTSIRPDTFSGIQNHRRVKIASEGNNDLLRELEQNAQRQILACQNMGYTHRGSRVAQSVLSLKDTVSPSAFHPSSFFSRHPPRAADGRSSRTGTPGDALAGEEGGRRKRLTHPTPSGKLSNSGAGGGGGGMKVLLHDRQDRGASRHTSLPTVCGSSMQVMLAQSNGNEKLV